MRCQWCGNANPATATECASCGRDLAAEDSTQDAIDRLKDLQFPEADVVCPSCGSHNFVETTFCTLCNTPLHEGAVWPESKRKPEPSQVAEPAQLTASTQEPTPASVPLSNGKPKVETPYFILGFIAPSVIRGLFAALASGVLAATMSLDDSGTASGVAGLVLGILPFGLVIGGALFLFIRGNRTGDGRLRSIGLGALWAIAAEQLLMLLLFGSCLVLLGAARFGG